MMAKARKPGADDTAALTLLGGAGHDLCQPIQSLLLMTHIMSLTEDGEKRKQTARAMEHALNMLQGMIGDLARIARMAAGSVPANHADVAVDTMLMRVAEQNRPLARSYALTVSVAAEKTTAQLDERLAAEIVNGLLRNAIVLSRGGDLSVAARVQSTDVQVEIQFDGTAPTTQQMNATFAEISGADAGAKPTPGLKMLSVMAQLMNASVSVAPHTESRQALTLSIPIRA